MVLRTDLTYLNLSMSLFTQPVRRILAEKRTWLALAIIVPLVLLVTCVHGTLFSSRSVVARVYLQARYIDTRTAHFSEPSTLDHCITLATSCPHPRPSCLVPRRRVRNGTLFGSSTAPWAVR